MSKVTKPTVRTIASGENLVLKQMKADAGDLLPEHLASVESLLFIHEGACRLMIGGKDVVLRQGDGHVIPPDVRHQIEALEDFKGIHVMPQEIEFQYF